MRARRPPFLLGATLLSVAAFAGACSSNAADSELPLTVAPRATISSAAGDTTVAATPSADPLDSLLITSVPSGYSRQADDVGDTGASDLAKAVNDDGRTDARAILINAGFVRGYQRLWQSDSEHQIVVFIYQFKTAEGADSFNTDGLNRIRSDSTIQSAPFPITGIPGAVGLSATGTTNSGAAAFFTKGVYMVQIHVVDPSVPTSEKVAQQVAADQFARL